MRSRVVENEIVRLTALSRRCEEAGDFDATLRVLTVVAEMYEGEQKMSQLSDTFNKLGELSLRLDLQEQAKSYFSKAAEIKTNFPVSGR